MNKEKCRDLKLIPHLNEIKAMFFDMDDTIVKYREPVMAGFNSIKESFPELENAVVDDMMKQFKELFSYEAVLNRDVSYREDISIRLSKILNGLGMDADDEKLHFSSVFWRAFWKKRRMVEGARDILHLCRKMKIPVAVITNGNPQIQFRTMIRLKLHDYVDVILTPRTIAEVKPSNFLFEKAMTIFDVEPQGVVMIGDSYSADMVGAMNAGIVPIWLNMSGNDNPEDGCVAEVSSLRELVDLIQRGDDSNE